MRIDTIKIQNFRGIVEAEYGLHPHVTVLLGNNAKGKSATLDALAILAGSYLLNLERDRISSYPIDKDEDSIGLLFIQKEDIRQWLSFTSDGFIQRHSSKSPCVLNAEGVVHGAHINWKRSLDTGKSETRLIDTDKIATFAKDIYEYLNDDVVTRPLIVYYSVARLELKRKEEISNKTKELPDLLDGYKNTLIGNTNQWIAERWFAGLQSRAYGGLDKAKEIFEMAKSKILALFQSVEPPLKDIRHDPEIDELFVLFENAEGFIPVSFLSSGYKSVLSMGLDIVYRMFILNPHLGAKAFDETPGIALVDEIDMHLHPKWQGHIIDDLRKAFPLLQFVVATHSAFVVQSLRDARIIDLDNERERDIGDYVKKSIPEIAEEYMGMENVERSPYFNAQVKAAEEYFTLLKSTPPSDPEKLAQAKKKLDEYEIQYERDPAFIALLRVRRSAAGLE